MFLYELPDFRQARIIGAPAEQTRVIDKDRIAATAAIRDNGQLPQYRSLQISFCRCATGIVVCRHAVKANDLLQYPELEKPSMISCNATCPTAVPTAGPL